MKPINFTGPLRFSLILFNLFNLEIFRNTSEQEDLEHVTPYMHKNKKNFKIKPFSLSENSNHLRFTIDTELDYLAVKKITSNLYHKFGYDFDMYQIIEFLENNIEIMKINKSIKRNESFNVFDL